MTPASACGPGSGVGGRTPASPCDPLSAAGGGVGGCRETSTVPAAGGGAGGNKATLTRLGLLPKRLEELRVDSVGDMEGEDFTSGISCMADICSPSVTGGQGGVICSPTSISLLERRLDSGSSDWRRSVVGSHDHEPFRNDRDKAADLEMASTSPPTSRASKPCFMCSPETSVHHRLLLPQG